MGKVRIKKNVAGELEFEVEVADEHVERVVSGAIERSHQLLGLQIGPARSKSRSGPLTGSDTSLTEQAASELKQRIPRKEQVAEFIVSQPERAHSLPDVSSKFLGRVIRVSKSVKAERQAFFLLQDRIQRARSSIEKSDRTGHFEPDQRTVGKPWVYRWRRGLKGGA
jgi:hypothetical protein